MSKINALSVLCQIHSMSGKAFRDVSKLRGLLEEANAGSLSTDEWASALADKRLKDVMALPHYYTDACGQLDSLEYERAAHGKPGETANGNGHAVTAAIGWDSV